MKQSESYVRSKIRTIRWLSDSILTPFGIALAAFITVCIPSAVHALPSSCQDTWYKRGEENKLAVSWNTPLPVLSTGDDSMPEAGPETAISSEDVFLTETTIDDVYSDTIGLIVSNLAAGQRITLEKYRVTNPVAGIQPDSVLVGSYTIQDGYAPAEGEVGNFNIPSDLTEKDGEIIAALDFYEVNVSSHAEGDYAYRVKSPTDAYAPVDIPFRVDMVESDQAFRGNITDAETGEPISDALVGVLNPLGLDNDFVYGTISNEDGSYRIFTAIDEYDLVAAAPGYVGPYGFGVSYFIIEDEYVDIELIPGDRTISGAIVDADNSEITLPGIEVLLLSVDDNGALDGRLFAITWTDENGAFSADVTEGRWAVVVRQSISYDRGYQGTSRVLDGLEIIDARSGSSADNQVGLVKGTSIIHGILTDEDTGEPIPGVEVRGIRDSDGANTHGITDLDGEYRLAVTEGYWNVFAVPYSLQDSGYSSPFPSDVKVGQSASSVVYDFTARATEGSISGFISDNNYSPIGKMEFRAVNQDPGTRELSFRNTDETDGFFSFELASGNWSVVPEPLQAAQRQLIFKDFPYITIPDDGSFPEIDADMITVESTGTMEITVLDAEGAPLEGIRAHAVLDQGGSEYHSFGVSDENGVAVIAAFDGTWEVHLSDRNLREQGFSEVEAFDVEVAGSGTYQANAEPFGTIAPELAIELVNDGSVNRAKIDGISVDSGQRYRLEMSDDLEEWRELGRVIAEGGLFEILDQTETVDDRLFYRVVQ